MRAPLNLSLSVDESAALLAIKRYAEYLGSQTPPEDLPYDALITRMTLAKIVEAYARRDRRTCEGAVSAQPTNPAK